MITKYFKCSFIDDVVLHSSSNTEGKIEILDYIPGAKFLGIVAKKYSTYEVSNNAFKLFHSANVRFGDAHLLYDSDRTYKVPFSYYTEKGLSSKNAFGLNSIKKYNQDQEREEIENSNVQYRQIRDGYMTDRGTYIDIVDIFRQKSARDKAKRRSDDGKMFGYRALQQDREWVFCVEFDDNDKSLVDAVCGDLIGKRSIGKSKSAEYGRVNIEVFTDSLGETGTHDIANGELFLYADSALILHNEYGMSTFQPTVANLRLPKGSKILFEKSQIRTRTYSPWNGARKTRDYERLLIEKGSVIVVDISKVSSFDIGRYQEEISKGVGAFRSEGFGKLLVNPKFLYTNAFVHIGETKSKPSLDSNLNLIKYLENSKKQKVDMLKIIKDVQRFINNNQNIYRGLSPNQWGNIRQIVENPTNQDLRDNIENHISSGVAKKQWEGDRADKFLDYLASCSKDKKKFVFLLAKEMPKRIKGSQNG